MRFLSSAIALATTAALVAADSCTQISGNYYCNAATAIEYENVGFSGSYTDVTSMDDCSCSTETRSFSGSLAPFSDDLSVHFRGPIQLKQVSVYTSSSESSSKMKKRDAHLHLHERQHAVQHQKRALEVVTEIVTMVQTIYYNPDEDATSSAEPSVSTISVNTASSEAVVAVPVETTLNFGAPTTDISVGPSGSVSTSAATTFSVSTTSSTSSSSTTTSFSSSSSSTSTSSSASSTTTISTSDWSRTAQYDSSSGTQSGITFLNNLGGTNGSGTWSSCWGNSLSYCNSDGETAAASSQVLGDVLVGSNTEFIMFSDTECTTDTCGYYRDGIPAFVGFSGDMKMFLFEFQMPSDSSSSASFNGDMPAIWFLNGRIPRTSQYGTCSCWASGCGEFDAFEVLSSGSNYMISTLHDEQGGSGGGSSDYFVRPTDSTMKAAVIFDGSSSKVFLVQLDDATDFGGSVSADTVADWMSSSATVVSLSS
ncbi:putative TOS1-like glycosyl hydrolase-domain-containing protein [Kockiozyma suomiensis]|uniref:putative TOS1-like glycosyl hydrolase-domain-containing protein n=1 Tax=Kockiozyma suomiensis TaxID=1337062 RepID=UPI00334367A8